MSQSPSGSNAMQKPPVSELVERLLAAKSQAMMVDALRGERRREKTKALASEIKSHVSVLERHLHSNRPYQAIATMLAMLFLDADYAISCMRRDGVLRASRYGYKGSLIGRVAKAGLGIQDLIFASPDRIAWLESVEALSRIAGNALSLQQDIERAVKAHRTVVLKTVFVIVNTMLYRGWINDPEANSLDGQRYSSEEYAEAASLILRTYSALFPIDDSCFNFIDPRALGANAVVYDRLLLAAIRLTKFVEAELLIDGLPYRADFEGQTVTVSSIDPNIERSVRIGYIQGHGQAMIRFAHLHATSTALSIRDVINQGFERGGLGKMLELVEHPVRRLRLRLPALPELFDAFFARDEFLRDELEMLLTLDVDNFGGMDDLIFPITDRVASSDIFKVQRYFNFLSSSYQKRLGDIADELERGELTLTSTVFVIPHEALVEQLRLIFRDEDKCREIIALLAMDPSDTHLDLQYRPFVNIGNYYVIAPHIVAASNLVRNTIVANRLRAAAIGPKDRMVCAIAEAMRSADFEVETDCTVKLDGQVLELDIVARRETSLFLFECKNAYHPVSVHEMRNSWDHIRSARKQLDVRQCVLSDPANQKHLFEKLGWGIRTCELSTGIVIANRVFHGANLNGHPIRQAHELINVLATGRIVTEEDSLSFWLGPKFQTADLVAYLGADSIAVNQLGALDPRLWTYAMGYRELAFSSYVLDMMKFDRLVREKYGPSLPGGRRKRPMPMVSDSFR